MPKPIVVPQATMATDIIDTAFVAHWQACDDALSYTLRVEKGVKPLSTLVLTETFPQSRFTGEGYFSLQSSLDDYMDNEGWTGTSVYRDLGGIRLGSPYAAGTLTTPALPLEQSGGMVTVKVRAKTYRDGADYTLTASNDNDSGEATVAGADEEELVILINCAETASEKLSLKTAAGKAVIITALEIYAGDATALLAPAVTNAGEVITIEGITDNYYRVTGLESDTGYFFTVKAIYDEEESAWSNKIYLTTATSGTTPLEGDVNGDGIVNAADVTALYNFLLEGDTTHATTSDVNADGTITAADVTTLYTIIQNALPQE